MRIGYGEDSHRLEAGLPLVIGGVPIEGSPLGAVAHSDGDVLLHALADSLLSAFALGDIGHYFPPSDPALRGLPGEQIVAHVLGLLAQQGEVRIGNVAAVVTLDTPKLREYRERIQESVARCLGVRPGRVGVTFKTSEGAATGHIQARVSLLLSVMQGA